MNMKSSVLSATLVAALAVFSIGSAAQAAGSSASSPAPRSVQGKAAKTVSGPLILYRSITSEDSGLVAVGAGFQAIDSPTTIFCPAAGGCVLTAEQNVQVRGTAANNRFAICTAVDGVFMAEPLCPFLGVVATTRFAANSFEQHAHVGPGNHSVQTFLFTDAGADRSIYHIEYSMYRGN